jgi:hypothetical protein
MCEGGIFPSKGIHRIQKGREGREGGTAPFLGTNVEFYLCQFPVPNLAADMPNMEFF